MKSCGLVTDGVLGICAGALLWHGILADGKAPVSRLALQCTLCLSNPWRSDEPQDLALTCAAC